MISNRVKQFTFVVLLILFTITGFSQEESNLQNNSLEKGIELLRKYFQNNNYWHITSEETVKNINSLIHFIEDQPVDSALSSLLVDTFSLQKNFVTRLPEHVTDSLNIPGFYSAQNLTADLRNLERKLWDKHKNRPVTLPMEVITEIEKNVAFIAPENGMKLFADSVYTLPDSLKIPEFIPDSLLDSPAKFKRMVKLDSLQKVYVENMRIKYNDSIAVAYRDSVILQIRTQNFNREFNQQKNRLSDSIKLNNYEVLKSYNDSVVSSVNDSIAIIVKTLSDYADFIDTTKINFTNLVNEKGNLMLRNNNEYFTRFWLKNEQKDSLGIMIKNINKRTVQLLIDDGVTFSRFKPRETKEFDFSTLNNTMAGLNTFGDRYKKHVPWQLGGDGNVGFTQTYLENWKKGGKSALSLLIVLKGSADYTRFDGKVKWENSAEIRNGWIRQGGEESETQKNDDKFEFTTRGGLSAFKKWYYSAELNFNTQFFNGYNYPTDKNPDPISGFLAPARTFFKLGLDYKPNKDFSVFLSPLTAKVVFVGDTLKVDPSKFSIPAGKKSFWTPGLNADLRYKTELAKNITYETKYKMFINYKAPFKKFDINWENLLNAQLTQYINMQMMVHMIYDDDVKFPVTKTVNGVEVETQEPRLQLKQLITVGFTYKINRQVTRAKRIAP